MSEAGSRFAVACGPRWAGCPQTVTAAPGSASARRLVSWLPAKAARRASAPWVKWVQPSKWTGTTRADGEDLGGLGGPVAGEGQVGAVEAVGDLDGTGEEDGHVDPAGARGDRAHHVQRRVVAGYVHRVEPGATEQEADHRAGDVVGPVGPVLGRHGGDRHR